MLDAMYEVPTGKSAKEFTVTMKYAREKMGKANINQLKVA
jgi:hypothetical protein